MESVTATGGVGTPAIRDRTGREDGSKRSWDELSLPKLAIDLGTWPLFLIAAAVIRLGDPSAATATWTLVLVMASTPILYLGIEVLGLHDRRWRDTSIADLLQVASLVGGLSIAMAFFAWWLQTAGLNPPRSVPLIAGALAVGTMAASRLATRELHLSSLGANRQPSSPPPTVSLSQRPDAPRSTEIPQPRRMPATPQGPPGEARSYGVLLVGCTPESSSYADALLTDPSRPQHPVGIVAESPDPPRSYRGLPVLGSLDELEELVEMYRASEVYIPPDVDRERLLPHFSQHGLTVRMGTQREALPLTVATTRTDPPAVPTPPEPSPPEPSNRHHTGSTSAESTEFQVVSLTRRPSR